ncbi:GNAT family N-acetyltransferase [Planctomonas sp. JC2975]|uniref:GNAT family N-acetyltransferase n=1 Tax=Planctomonas sp. JC2975 TaxID=2729626 RepID=UPI0014727E37|nr:GNAT family N-acetyltransferase [Planctomonas sp. JC2975]NNC11453.1 GNAT family N-acetyltransferase [Planctomonas sp. JC2975]
MDADASHPVNDDGALPRRDDGLRLISDDGAVEIRDAVPADAEAIARVHVDTWRETYSGVLAERYFSEEAYQDRPLMWTGYLSLRPRPGRLSVAVHDGRIVGFANAADSALPAASHGIPPARPLHLFAIYVRAAVYGTGTGRALLDAVIGDDPAQLWVLRGNERAIAFYERNGFAFDGVEYRDPADDRIELRMVR